MTRYLKIHVLHRRYVILLKRVQQLCTKYKCCSSFEGSTIKTKSSTLYYNQNSISFLMQSLSMNTWLSLNCSCVCAFLLCIFLILDFLVIIAKCNYFVLNQKTFSKTPWKIQQYTQSVSKYIKKNSDTNFFSDVPIYNANAVDCSIWSGSTMSKHLSRQNTYAYS